MVDEQIEKKDPSVSFSTEKPHSILEKWAEWLENWPVTRFFASLAHFMLIAAIVTLWVDYNERRKQADLLNIQLEQWGKERDFQSKSRIFAAWQTINTEAPGNSGKREAVEFLSQLGITLIGIDLSCERNAGGWNSATLECARPVLLTHVDLHDDTMDGALMRQSKLQGVDFFGAELENVDFEMADLSGAILSSADVTGTNFESANVSATKFTGEKRLLIEGNLIKGLTSEQINKAWAWRDQPPILPDGIEFASNNLCNPMERVEYSRSNRSGRPGGC